MIRWPRSFRRTPLASWASWAPWTMCAVLLALSSGPAPSALPQDAAEAVEIPPAPTEYMGRRIAKTMHWKGAEWLLRKSREEEERTSLLLANLGVLPGQTVCDLGCGNGFHTLRLAEQVGEEGKVIGVDIQPEMLAMLAERAKEQGVANVEGRLATAIDPRLEPDSCDLILLADVYHEISHPEQVLRAIHAALRPKGRVVLVEFRAEDPEVPIKKLHKMSKVQIRKELEANGFALAEQFDELPWQHVMFFERAAAARTAPADAEPSRKSGDATGTGGDG